MTKQHRTPIRQHTHLIGHASSYEIEEVFEQARVVLSVQVCQWSLLSDGSIRIQFCDQRPAETTAGLISPQLQGMESVFPTHEQSPINLSTRFNFILKSEILVKYYLPVHRFGIVFNVIREVSYLIFGYTLQPIHHELNKHTHTPDIQEFFPHRNRMGVNGCMRTWLCRTILSFWKNCSITAFSLSLGISRENTSTSSHAVAPKNINAQVTINVWMSLHWIQNITPSGISEKATLLASFSTHFVFILDSKSLFKHLAFAYYIAFKTFKTGLCYHKV